MTHIKLLIIWQLTFSYISNGSSCIKLNPTQTLINLQSYSRYPHHQGSTDQNQLVLDRAVRSWIAVWSWDRTGPESRKISKPGTGPGPTKFWKSRTCTPHPNFSSAEVEAGHRGWSERIVGSLSRTVGSRKNKLHLSMIYHSYDFMIRHDLIRAAWMYRGSHIRLIITHPKSAWFSF